jgi:hypothetical protein
MFRKIFVITVFLILSMVSGLFSEVPPARIHQPEVPYFLDSMNFLTVKMQIFTQKAAGMVADAYGDLIWNPAFILNHEQKSIYLDFTNFQGPGFTVPKFSDHTSYYVYNSDSFYRSRWEKYSHVHAVQSNPIYNLAAILPLSSKLTIGVSNRVIYDHGPYLDLFTYDWKDDMASYSYSNYNYGSSNLVPDTLDIEENQQQVTGMQSEVTLGYNLTSKLDLGLRFGHFSFTKDGNLWDEEIILKMHTSLNSQKDDSSIIKGDHIEGGIGLVYHMSKKLRVGIFTSLTKGDSSDEAKLKDRLDRWYERALEPEYYSDYHYKLETQENSFSDGKKPRVVINFEYKMSKKMNFRSFFSYSWSDINTTGSTTFNNNSHNDYTYDYWDYNTNKDYFRRYVSHSFGESQLQGTESKEIKDWKWFASLFCTPRKAWSFWGGILIQNYSLKKKTQETSSYQSDRNSEYSISLPKTSRYYYSHQKDYSLQANFNRWSASLPFGIITKIFKGLHLLVGADVTFFNEDYEAEAIINYPEIITRRWENGRKILDEKEIDRYEKYVENPYKEFNRTFKYFFGLEYQFGFGGKLFFRSNQDIFKTTNWALGFEMNW